jgi:hypothetical protein
VRRNTSSRRVETEFGEKYLITRASVEKHIAYTKEANTCDQSRRAATVLSRYVARLEGEIDFLRSQMDVKIIRSRK